ncbi:DNA-directed RNA polymerase II subunit RPB1-like [Arachis duranensis]|uniref:DNA-directed RNA polymerase subunit n=1 Tax=Arachis duranensis TaxID=130453 RepID=A0A6P4BPL2_ARADU|nr:DNA-directed RNA polymerase II subunit RPB1-like [Arachis duranensis]
MDIRFSFPYSPAETAKVRALRFQILSPDDIRRMSVVEIEHGIENPKVGGLSDPRLGTVHKNIDCDTCGADMDHCPGHFGHLELAKPVFHVGLLNTVLAVMRCVCFNCSKILSGQNNKEFKQALKITNPKSRLEMMVNACKNKSFCEGDDGDFEDPIREGHDGCGARQPKLTINGMKMIAEHKIPRKKEILSAEKVLDILKGISDEDCQLLGLNTQYVRPEWMILQVLPIPPPSVRPSVMIDASSRIEDDLTHQLVRIIRSNKNLKSHESNGSPARVISKFAQLLEFHIATYFDSALPGLPRAAKKRPIKSICSRHKEDDGQIRGMLGKRVDFSARTLITPDPNINIDEVGVPRSIALNLTYPETVTPYNITRLKELVEYGPDPPPGKTGAKYIIRDNGQRLDLRYLEKSSDLHLEIGYKVERHLEDGDLVLLNRRPSLHKMSIMGHKIKILPYSTFRLNMLVTKPYNVNFDGDEMDMHVPQSFETRTEVLELMMVPKCIVSPQSNRPVMDIVQDTLLGCRKITKRDTFITKDVFMNILMWWEDFDGKVPAPAILKPEPLWTGKQVLNLIIPKQINLTGYSSWHDHMESGSSISPGDTVVRIEKGELLTGTLCKETLGTFTGRLVHAIWVDVGPDASRKFLGHIQWLVNYWLLQNSFSIGIGDTIADASTMEFFNRNISEAKKKVKYLIRDAQEQKLEAKPGSTMMDTHTLEKKVIDVLIQAHEDAIEKVKMSLSESNNLKAMVTAGSKGSFINISQMTACLGQQNVEGKRIPFGFTDRTLPHFVKDDYGTESRGFVENSYLHGLSPQDFFFHAMGSREGFIDNAVRVYETGYIQRQLVKALEDIMVKYDGTVRNSLGDVIQFLYGEDGMDAVWIETQNLDSLKMKKSDFNRTFRYEFDNENWNPSYMLEGPIEELKTSIELRTALEAEVLKLACDRCQLATEITCNSSLPLPVNLKRLIRNAQKAFKIDFQKPSDMHPLEILEAVDRLQERLKVVPGNDLVSQEAQKNATLLFNILLRSTLASKRILQEYRLSREAFEWVVGEIESRFQQSLVTAGEMTGCVAAQSIGDLATKLTLETFHYVGLGAKNVTLGVPRLREIIKTARRIQTPSLSVHLNPGSGVTSENVKRVQCDLEHTTLRRVTHTAEVWYDPEPMSTIIEEDVDFVKSHFETPDEEVALEGISPWLLRIELDREMMVDKKLSMAGIAEKINLMFNGDLECIFNDDTAEKLVLRFRIMNNEAHPGEIQDGSADSVFLKIIGSNMLSEMTLRGIPGINKVFMKAIDVQKFNEEDGFQNHKEWMLETEGVNLLAVMCHEHVDAARTTSNHLIEIIKVLGIEAVRRALLDELRAVMSFDGFYVNYRHLALLCDTMTYRGHLMAITRNGVDRNDAGPMMRFSFEETVNVLHDATVYAETDHLRGIRENNMLGLLAPFGTGQCALYPNQDMLKNSNELQLPS